MPDRPHQILVFDSQASPWLDMPDDFRAKRNDSLLADYGYALTCHKAQGSEWPSVVVMEDWVPRESAAKWRYTAATRAKETLIYGVD